LRIEEPTLRKELWQTIKAGTPADASAIRQRVTRAAGAQPTVAEQKLLELLIHDEDLRRIILPQLETPVYEVLPTAAIFRTLIQLEKEGAQASFDRLSAEVEADEELTKLLALLWWSEPQRERDEALDDVQVIAESCLAALRLMAIDRQLSELGTEIAEAERAGETERSNRLVMERLELARRRSEFLPRTEAAHSHFGF
jgi:replicative DNA helicase